MSEETGIQMKTMEEIAKEHFERQMELIRKRAAEDVQTDSIVGSCNCNVKTPDTQYHAVGCKYRLIVERDELRQRIADLERQLREVRDSASIAEMELANAGKLIGKIKQERQEKIAEAFNAAQERDQLRAATAEQAKEIERLTLNAKTDFKLIEERGKQLHQACEERDQLRGLLAAAEVAINQENNGYAEDAPWTGLLDRINEALAKAEKGGAA